MPDTILETTIPLANLASLPAGQGRCFIVGSEEIAVFRQRDGRLFAVQNRCPHRQGSLAEGMVGNNTVICPLHSHKFDLASGRGNEEGECLRVFPVSVEDQQVVLTLKVY